MILNATKNLAMSMNNLNLSLTNIHQKVNQLTTPTPTPIVKNETKEEVKEETTSN